MSDQHWQKECLGYVGRSQTASDRLLANTTNLFQALLRDDRRFVDGDEMPLLFHWLYFHAPIPSDKLGEDGHERLGQFLPPVPYPRRMWAGSHLTFHQPLILGVEALRRSEIRSVEFKQGSSGPLCFVTVGHTLQQIERKCIEDVHTIVYRGKGDFRNLELAPANSQSLSPVDLFRYSALTYNAHRIHYDHDYVRKVEQYPDLVVHGPLMATLLMRSAQGAQPGRPVSVFQFRGHAPVFSGEGFDIEYNSQGYNTQLFLNKTNQVRAMSAEVTYRSA